jgi:hypothetical protein
MEIQKYTATVEGHLEVEDMEFSGFEANFLKTNKIS